VGQTTVLTKVARFTLLSQNLMPVLAAVIPKGISHRCLLLFTKQQGFFEGNLGTSSTSI